MSEEQYEDTETVEEAQIDADDIAQEDIADAETAPEPVQAPVKEWTDEDEEEARLFGWKAPEEWAGEKPAGYIDKPTDFLTRVQRSRIFRTMQDKLAETEAKQAKLDAMNQKALERQRAQYETRLSDITKEQRRAVDDADTDRFDALEEERQGLSKQLSAPAEVEAPQADPYVEQYVASEQGAWTQNPVLRKTGYDLIQGNPAILAMPAAKQLEYAEAEVRKMFPAYFPSTEKPKPAPRATVDGGGLAGGAPKTASAFAKLPPDVKAHFARFVKDGIFQDNKTDQEEYAREYNS